ncbi:hypothetical protein LINPERPRIM_LOCUS28081 [Linum perenne]
MASLMGTNPDMRTKNCSRGRNGKNLATITNAPPLAAAERTSPFLEDGKRRRSTGSFRPNSSRLSTALGGAPPPPRRLRE